MEDVESLLHCLGIPNGGHMDLSQSTGQRLMWVKMLLHLQLVTNAIRRDIVCVFVQQVGTGHRRSLTADS